MGFNLERLLGKLSEAKRRAAAFGITANRSSDYYPNPTSAPRPPQPTSFPGSSRPTKPHPHPQPHPSNTYTTTLYHPPPPLPPHPYYANMAPTNPTPCPYPFHLRIEDLSHAAIPHFNRCLPHLPTLLPQLHTTITTLLYPHHPPPEVRSVTLIIRAMPGVAYTTGTRLDDAHKEIHLSADYILSCASTDSDRCAELEGVLLHELVHCLQFSRGCPGGLIEGIADFVRLRGGKGAKHWKREGGKKRDWCSGYSRTGYFLDWIEEVYGSGSVAWVNESMREREYDEDVFREFTELSVHKLWKRYKRTYELEECEDGSDSEGEC